MPSPPLGVQPPALLLEGQRVALGQPPLEIPAHLADPLPLLCRIAETAVE